MKVCYVTFRSITYAQRGQTVLQKRGIYGEVVRTPRPMNPRGCGYSVRLRQREVEMALQILDEMHVPYETAYCRSRDGELEEVL